MYRTKNCIECSVIRCEAVEATRWTGHVLRGKQSILAGFCEEHKDAECPNINKKMGCFGYYNERDGLINETDFDNMVNSVINSNKDGGF